MTDEDAIRDVLAGRHERFNELVRRHFAAVSALCLSYIKDPVKAEDAVQETFVRCYNRLDTLESPGKFAAWLAAIARSVCLNQIKVVSRHKRLLADFEEITENRERAMDVERLELQQTVRSIVDELPAKTREAVYLFYFEEKSLKEIGDYLGKSPNAVASLLKYGRRKLKDRLWEEAADSIKRMRPKKEALARACAAIPLGTAPWCVQGGVAGTAAAAGTAKTVITGGILTMSTKSIVAAGGIALVALMALLAWSPWSRVPETSATPRTTLSEERPAAREVQPVVVDPVKDQTADVAVAEPDEPAVAEAPDEEEDTPEDAEEETDQALLTASVAGYVRDDRGRPFAGADIHLEMGRAECVVDVVQVHNARTGADGRYTITGINTFGHANVYAFAEGCVMQREFLRGVLPGSEYTADFTLRKATFFVAGRVVSETGAPIPGASVNLRYYGYDEEGIAVTAETGRTTGAISDTKFLFAVTDETGQFLVAVPSEGLCDFTVLKEGYGTGFFARIPTGTEDAEFVLRGYGAISGTVTWATGGPVEGAAIIATGEAFPGGLPLGEVRIQELAVPPVRVVTDGAGRYTAGGLSGDYAYRVTVGKVPGDLDLAMAETRGVRVEAGRTTPGVDFVLAAATYATVYGRVTDLGSGVPVCPLEISATEVNVNPDDFIAVIEGPRATTLPDGTYEIQVDLDSGNTFRVRWRYVNEGGGEGFSEDAEVAIVELEAGDEKEVNFSVHAPITVPMRFVDNEGNPLAGICAGARPAESRGGWGSSLASGADGRVVYHGLNPARAYRAVGRAGDQVVGQSEPFAGQPGETVPEVVVVCLSAGGIEGIVIDAEGNALANTQVMWTIRGSDGTVGSLSETTTDANGKFCVLDGLSEGTYPEVFVGRQKDEQVVEYASVQNVNVEANAVTDLGTLNLKPIPMEQAMQMLGGGG